MSVIERYTNEDGTVSKGCFRAVQALNFIRNTGLAYHIDPEWDDAEVSEFSLAFTSLSVENNYAPIIQGRVVKLLRIF